MAYTAANLALISSVNGFGLYRYDTVDDDLDVVEDAGFFNNSDDSLNLAVGDIIKVVEWATAVRTGTISGYKEFIVTNVISNDAASSAGNVNIAEIGIASDGAISSGD